MNQSSLPCSSIPASIEVTARQVNDTLDLAGLFPLGTRVYIPDMGSEPDAAIVAAARTVREHGYTPVPHVAARRLATRDALQRRIGALTQEAGVDDVLIIAGGLNRPLGEYDSSLSILETGIFERYGVRQIGIAGHPEGSPDFSEEVAFNALRLKQAFMDRSDAKLRIVTQFAFDPRTIIAWIQSLDRNGVDLPVHVGVAGPCKIPTLLKYAALCGVGNSLNVLRKQSASMLTLAAGYSPERVVSPIERYWREKPCFPLEQLHVFTFGGAVKTAAWLVERGSWMPSTFPSNMAVAN